MGDPPDRPNNNLPSLQWDKNKKTTITNLNDPIYLLMTRINSNENLSNISPFLLKKAIDNTCGQVLECKKIRSGQILIKTKNLTQANKLITLTAITNDIKIEISEHKFLNSSKGVIYSNELRGITEEEILEELKSQNVIEVKKILKKKEKEEALIETGLIILKFQSTNIPSTINIGYSRVPIRAYIPPPLRCKNCLKYNHTANYCKNEKICFNCGSHHILEDTGECYRPKRCSNCSSANLIPSNHTAIDRKCPIFIKEQELQAIKVTYKIDNSAAKQLYEERHQHSTTTYATITKLPEPTTTKSPAKTSTITKQVKLDERTITDYSDLTQLKKSNISQNVTIYPRNTSKRTVSELKKASKSKGKKPKTTTQSNQHPSEEETMELSDTEEAEPNL